LSVREKREDSAYVGTGARDSTHFMLRPQKKTKGQEGGPDFSLDLPDVDKTKKTPQHPQAKRGKRGKTPDSKADAIRGEKEGGGGKPSCQEEPPTGSR